MWISQTRNTEKFQIKFYSKWNGVVFLCFKFKEKIYLPKYLSSSFILRLSKSVFFLRWIRGTYVRRFIWYVSARKFQILTRTSHLSFTFFLLYLVFVFFCACDLNINIPFMLALSFVWHKQWIRYHFWKRVLNDYYLMLILSKNEQDEWRLNRGIVIHLFEVLRGYSSIHVMMDEFFSCKSCQTL